MQKSINNALDFRWHGCREKQGLTRHWREFENAFNVWDKSHIKHTVGFIDNHHFNTVHQQPAPLEMVEQAARCGDQNINAAHQFGFLITKRNTAN